MVTLPLLFSDGAVLQQKTPVRIYGTATAGEKVTVTLAGKTQATTADAKGNWEVKVGSFPAGGPHTLTVQGATNTLTRKDILFGEVWICSGQSNMEWNMDWNPMLQADVPRTNDPQLRMFTVQKSIAATPQGEVASGKWEAASPQTAGHFSAVGLYFAQALRKALGVPVGMIHTSWGGTRIEAWTEKSILVKNGTPEREFAYMPTAAQKAEHERRVQRWKEAGSPQGMFTDPGRADKTRGWETGGGVGWKPIAVPALWDAAGAPELVNVDGGVWCKREISIPNGWNVGEPATLSLGPIDDWDTTFVNGTQVGKMEGGIPNVWMAKRVYPVPAGLLKPGKNVVVVRIWDHQGGGGIYGSADEVFLQQGNRKIPLAGNWQYLAENIRPENPGAAPGMDANSASGLYNAMLYPVRKYTVKGTIWYQGESNTGNPSAYRKQLPAMITNWRQDFGIPDMPFGVVQLAPWQKANLQPEDSGWADLRDSQLQTARTMKNVGLAVITDVGDEVDIHPVPKRPVGDRLANWALSTVYKQKVPKSSPLFKSATTANGTLTVTFETWGGNLVAHHVDSLKRPVPDGKILGFAIAGDDGMFHWADAKITGAKTVALTSPNVPNPTKVRFGWANFPIVNLFDASGLPVCPFSATVKRR